MAIIWTDKALRRLEDAYDQCLEISLKYARDMTQAMLAKTDLIETFPRIGTMEPQFCVDDREVRSILESHFRIVYEILRTDILILTIWNLRLPDSTRQL